MERQRWRVRVRGIVQGVGFRPFVYRLAGQYGLDGWVKNDDEGVLCEIEGAPSFLREFLQKLKTAAPAASRIASVDYIKVSALGTTGFVIEPSRSAGSQETLISPDLAICRRCREEILNPADRRFGYAFTSCTDCGPRYSIVTGAPYDRERTSMAEFGLCGSCAEEYTAPGNRRFHAEPDACPVCGPQLAVEDSVPGGNGAGKLSSDAERIDYVRQQIAMGKIVAIKGIGGFHLAVDATNAAAVKRLRQRKRRPKKPLAVMAGSLERIREFAEVSAAEAQLLQSAAAPIVLLRKKPGSDIAAAVAPDNAYIGVMLPYAPLNVLLLKENDVWVMTSGNLSGEPQLTESDEAREKLATVADAFLFHNRRIVNAVDDSVMRAGAAPAVLRRGRGLAPAPLAIADGPEVLAAGAELKSAFCYAKGRQAFLSEHLGDLKNQLTYTHYKAKLQRYPELFSLHPELCAVDLHPDYLSTQYVTQLAKERQLPLLAVQHHEAHIASVLAEHAEQGEVIGLAFDGTGYGSDGRLWGGEVFTGSLRELTRRAHFAYRRLPGGEKAAQEPWRLALPVLYRVFSEKLGEKRPDYAEYFAAGGQLLLAAAESGLNSPESSSLGRLFDAVAAILGICYVNTYEGEAACALEQAALRTEQVESLPYEIREKNGMIEIDFEPLLEKVSRRFDGSNAAVLARSFHVAVVRVSAAVVRELSKDSGVTTVALSGGVFQNELLCRLFRGELGDFRLLFNREVPANDGGIAYGQAAIARSRKYRG